MTPASTSNRSRERSKRQDSLWKHVPSIAIPQFVFRDGSLQLTPSELAVYVCICNLAERPRSNGEFSISVDELSTLTGYERRQVERALAGLCEKKFIGTMEEDVRDDKGDFAPAPRTVTSPNLDGASISEAPHADRRQNSSLSSLLFSTRESYFSAPENIVEILANLKGTPLGV